MAAPRLTPVPAPDGRQAAERRLIVSVGAELDAAAFEAEIRVAVVRKERLGVYPADLMVAITPDPVRDALEAVRDASGLSIDAPTASHRPYWAAAISFLKGLMARALRWHTRWLIGQMRTFSASVVVSLETLETRARQHDAALDRLAAQAAMWQAVAALSAAEARVYEGGAASDVHPAEGYGFDRTAWDAAWRMAAYQDDLRSSGGRIVHIGCGRGDLLAMLGAQGIDCFGVEPAEGLVAACLARGLDVLRDDALGYLRSCPPGSVAGIIAGRLPDELGVEAASGLLRLAAAALSEGGLLIAETRSMELSYLAQAAGFKHVQVRHLGGASNEPGLLPLPAVSDPALRDLMDILSANLRRVAGALQGPGHLAVVARR